MTFLWLRPCGSWWTPPPTQPLSGLGCLCPCSSLWSPQSLVRWHSPLSHPPPSPVRTPFHSRILCFWCVVVVSQHVSPAPLRGQAISPCCSLVYVSKWTAVVVVECDMECLYGVPQVPLGRAGSPPQLLPLYLKPALCLLSHPPSICSTSSCETAPMAPPLSE